MQDSKRKRSEENGNSSRKKLAVDNMVEELLLGEIYSSTPTHSTHLDPTSLENHNSPQVVYNMLEVARLLQDMGKDEVPDMVRSIIPLYSYC